MSLYRILKEVFIRPLSRTVPTTLLGHADQWAVLRGSLGADSFIISAGVGHSITFEKAIIDTFGATIVLLDPSPTGLRTIADLTDRSNIEFHAMGLAGTAGTASFGRPDRADEGSFRKGGTGDDIAFDCTSVEDLARKHGRTTIDLLKIDVEGFEYEILESVLANRVDVTQICVEIHHNRSISIDKSIVDAARLIVELYRAGYRIIYNKNLDFTFVRRRRIAELVSA